MMRPPCELVQREFLPDLRASLSRTLAEKGLSQIEIAEKIGLTQAAVSKYLKQEKKSRNNGYAIDTLSSRIADSLLSNSETTSEILKDICGTCMSLRIGSEICFAHKKAIPSLDESDCSICSELLGGSDPKLASRSQVLNDLQEGLRIILASRTFIRLVPEVRANIVSASKEANDVMDVAGVPGRITAIGGKARAFVAPRFGASKHTATLLLAIKDKWSSYRACICLSGRKSVVDAASKAGVKVIELNESKNDPLDIANATLSKIKRRPKKFLGIHVPGGIGVEPILYVFGRTARGLGDLSENLGSILE